MKKNKKQPLISIIIPTKNSGRYLSECLFSIKKQSYKNVEILIVDGCSSDDTLKIAKEFNCRAITNRQILAEPGVSLGISKAKGELCLIIAVDNFFEDEDALEKMVHIFLSHKISIIFPKHSNKCEYNIITKYINTFSDPFTHFIKGYASNGRTFSKIYKVVDRCKSGLIYNFKDSNILPTIALAQGILIEKKIFLNRSNVHDDILPIITTINKGYDIAFAEEVKLYHNTVNNLGHFFRKQRWSASNAFLRKKSGIASRFQTLSYKERLLSFAFPFYGILFLPALFFSLYRIIIKKESVIWFMHPPLSFVSALAIWTEFFHSLIGCSKNNTSRQPK